MNFSIPVGNGHVVEYVGNWYTGAEQLKADGKIIFQLPIDEAKKITETGCRRTEFIMGANDPIKEPIKVIFEIEQPYFYSGLRPYTYRVYADGKLLHEVTGF